MPRKPKSPPNHYPWYFVVRIADLSTVHYGRDEAEARSYLDAGTVLATGDTFGAAE